MTDFASSSLAINLSRIAAICEEEWQSFLDDVNIHPIPERQDLRGFFLNWVAVFAPEAYPSSLISRMASWMAEHRATDSTVWAFAKPPLIGATLFALTNSSYWLDEQISNFAYGGSDLRSFLHNTLALIAPLMSFDAELLARLEYGMKVPYFGMDTPLVLYAASKGDPAVKLANLRKWQESYFMNIQEKETVERFLKGDPANNPLQYWFLKNTSYVMLRLACEPGGPPEDATLPLGITLSDIWERVRKHPMVSSHVRLQSPTDRKSSG
jgi:hypothetical protein